MAINLFTSLLNIGLSITLGWGLGPFPRLGVVGVGIGTAVVAKILSTLLLLAAMSRPQSAVQLAFPKSWIDPTIMRQFVRIGMPKLMNGGVRTGAEFPFNALVTVFGTEIVAGYHIDRRIEQQISGPFQRGYHVSGAVLVGQNVGAASWKVPVTPNRPCTAAGVAGGMLGLSYVASVILGWGVPGIYAGVVPDFALASIVVALAFHRGGWPMPRNSAGSGSNSSPRRSGVVMKPAG